MNGKYAMQLGQKKIFTYIKFSLMYVTKKRKKKSWKETCCMDDQICNSTMKRIQSGHSFIPGCSGLKNQCIFLYFNFNFSGKTLMSTYLLRN